MFKRENTVEQFSLYGVFILHTVGNQYCLEENSILYKNQDVELIILPIGEPSPFKQAIPPSPTARGALKQYANSDLIQFEQGAWEKGVQEKHEHC